MFHKIQKEINKEKIENDCSKAILISNYHVKSLWT